MIFFHIRFTKLLYSEKATKFCEISTLLLFYVVPVKSKVEISQNCVAFSEYMNFNVKQHILNTIYYIFCRNYDLKTQKLNGLYNLGCVN